MELKLFNTLGRNKQLFTPIEKETVGMYSCGLTVYNYAHIGNLRAYVFADILKRTLSLNNFKVKHVVNITDVGHLSDDEDSGEDKLEAGARRENKTVWEISRFYTEHFLQDLKALNIIIPDIVCKATDHIQDMIDFIKVLEEKGFTYTSGGNVYFDTTRSRDYGKLTGSKNGGPRNSRVEADPYKKNQSDFVLWFTRYKYSNHAMLWDSPWGRGFPGWHIECSTMSSKYLGERFDIHTGGIDHIAVHHTNEIAQSEAAFGHDWVNFWLHCDFLVMNNSGKMAKSKGNFIRLKDLEDRGYSPGDYRYYLLNAHYRKPLAFSFEALDGAKKTMRNLRNSIMSPETSAVEIQEEEYNFYMKLFIEAINDDLNTPRALAVMWKLLENKSVSRQTKSKLIEQFDRVFGLDLLKEETHFEVPEEINVIISTREKARKEKDWEKADELRTLLREKGFDVNDTQEGSVVHKI